jgi:DNA-binding CsgD family transcriptional regulator
VVWIEGEPGIGKSSLAAEALSEAMFEADQPQWDVGWAGADQLTRRLPLRVMQDCLQVRPSSPDPRRAHAASLLHDRRLGPLAGGDASVDGIEVLLTLADELCAAAPAVLVVDDLQWADEASLAVWHQLAASISQLRLLLIGTCRPTPRTRQVRQVRAGVVRRGGQVITLGPLAETDVTALVAAMVGASPGDGLRQLTAQAAGNPLYVRELVDTLLREQAVQITKVAAVSPSWEQLPLSLAAVLEDRLSSVSAETAQVLRTAALLGGRFAVTDLAVVLGKTVSDVAANIQEAVAAGIVADSEPELVFRHDLIRQALYEGMPAGLRTALHAEAARELAAAGADVLSVGQQLSAGMGPGEDWVRAWLIKAGNALVTRAPQLAVELLRQELQEMPVGDEAWDVLVIRLIRALLAVGDYREAAGQARKALRAMTDPVQRGETSWLLAHAQTSAGRNGDAVAVTRQALAEADLPLVWRARLLALLAWLEREPGGIDQMGSVAREALTAAERAADPFATAQALIGLWVVYSAGRDHVTALDCIDRALDVLGDDPAREDLRSVALDIRISSLQNLGEWPRAELALRQSREFAQRTGRADRATWATAAVLRYWLGQWDDALAELAEPFGAAGLAYSFLRERWSVLYIHGVAALIAGRREQRTTARQHLTEGLALPIENVIDRDNQDYLVAAHALSLEQGGQIRLAMLRLAEILRYGGEMTLTHQWLPDLVRLALAAGDRKLALTAAEACAQEAASETRAARAAAASLRCFGLLESDPDRLAQAVAHYRTVGPAAELPAALEDLAVVLAERGHHEDARAALHEATGLYEDMQARWDIRRAEGRLRPYGIKLGVPRSRRGLPATSGWGALTPTEVKIAALVARGDSTSDIARGMFLSRRTVQTYISRILAKLEAKSRVDIVREALLRGVSP